MCSVVLQEIHVFLKKNSQKVFHDSGLFFRIQLVRAYPLRLKLERVAAFRRYYTSFGH